MLDLRYVTENLSGVQEQLRTRNIAASSLERLAELADTRRSCITEVEGLRQKRNEVSKSLATIDKSSEEFATQRAAMKEVGQGIKRLESQQKEVEAELDELLLNLPNLPHESAPVGANEDANVALRVWGEQPQFDFEAKDHVDLGTALDILDFSRASKVCGSRFTVLKGLGSRLERALIQYMMDTHVDAHGYTELWPPALVRSTSMRGTGQLPKFADDAFRVAREYHEGDQSERHDLYLSPTAEVQVTNFHAEEILDASRLPLRYCAYSACFRSEAGSYGKDTRGLIRQHQFDKVELVHFCRPEDALEELTRLTGHAEKILQGLGLHYRVIELCTGDLGFSSEKTYDLEVWLPAQGKFREISSCSSFNMFQARRAKIRYRTEGKGKPKLVATLNGSALAVGRTLVAILEQNQRADGSVVIPEALRPYMGGHELIGPVQ